MKSTRKWIAGIMAVLMLVLMAACGNGGNAANENKAGYRTLEEIKAAGTINIGVFSDKNPFGYVDENGEYQGYDVYFARRLAALGATIRMEHERAECCHGGLYYGLGRTGEGAQEKAP